MAYTNDNNFNNYSKQAVDYIIRKEIIEALPLNIRNIMRLIPEKILIEMEEIRLRINRPLIIYVRNRDYQVNEKGELVSATAQGYMITKNDMEKAYQLITNYSIYALEDEIRQGFITLLGGHRVGICGRVVLDKNQIKTIKDISGLNIRIAKQKIGISDRLMSYLLSSNTEFYNTLIVSPPQCGKTTLLRDIVRNLSNGLDNPQYTGFKVGVVDERSEIAACFNGIPQNNIGIRTDVLDGCPKAEGIMMLIRSMSPEIIATDEIGKKQDMDAIEEALSAGIKLITTVHGKDLKDVIRRPLLSRLIKTSIFERIIILTNKPKVGSIHCIIDGSTHKDINTYSFVNGGNECVC